MKTESLLYSYESVFNLMPVILEQRGCVILSANSNEGIIRAMHRNNSFHRENGVSVKLDKVDNDITTVTFWVSPNEEDYQKDVLSSNLLEEKLLRTIHKYF